MEELQIGLKYVQSFDPAGVGGARLRRVPLPAVEDASPRYPHRADALKIVDGNLECWPIATSRS